MFGRRLTTYVEGGRCGVVGQGMSEELRQNDGAGGNEIR